MLESLRAAASSSVSPQSSILTDPSGSASSNAADAVRWPGSHFSNIHSAFLSSCVLCRAPHRNLCNETDSDSCRERSRLSCESASWPCHVDFIALVSIRFARPPHCPTRALRGARAIRSSATHGPAPHHSEPLVSVSRRHGSLRHHRARPHPGCLRGRRRMRLRSPARALQRRQRYVRRSPDSLAPEFHSSRCSRAGHARR